MSEEMYKWVVTDERTGEPVYMTPFNTRYEIFPGYSHRVFALQSTREVNIKDECQDGVYKVALEVSKQNHIKSILDLGCGGGYKLLKYFSKYITVGLDTPETVQWLHEHYPQRSWSVSPLCQPGSIWAKWRGYEMVICSDMIEHVENPEQVLDFIVAVRPKVVVISTPDRDRLPEQFRSGPPRNTAHYREWSVIEFIRFVSSKLKVVSHKHPDPVDASQLVIAEMQ